MYKVILKSKKHIILISSLFSLSACAGTNNLNQSLDTNSKLAIKKQTHKKQSIKARRNLITGTKILAPHEHKCVWERASHNFKLKFKEHRKEIKKFIPHYNQYHIKELSAKAEPYLHYIIKELERRNLPGELALLPIIESCFNPFALSPVGPIGIWQLNVATGKRFGTSLNHWFDGRGDITVSTNAALNYIEYLYKKFDKDWLLTLAAYNSGEGWVDKAIKKNKRLKRSTDFWSLSLPKETRNYVPKLLALASIIKKPNKYKIKLPQIKNVPYLTLLDIGKQIDLAYAAKISEMSLKQLKRFNPGYTKWATNPEGPHLLLLPVENAQKFTENLSNPNIRKYAMTSRKYIIKRGDNLSKIAKRFKVTINQLKERNKMINDVIIAGKHIFIPFHADSFDLNNLTKHTIIS